MHLRGRETEAVRPALEDRGRAATDGEPVLHPVAARASSRRAAESDPDPSRDPSPEQLAEAAAAGDRTAFERLVRRFESPLVAFLVARTGCREDALELAQETFLRAWSARGRFDPARRYSTWLYTIAVRLATSRLRRAGVRRRVGGEAGLEGLADHADPGAASAAADQGSTLWATARAVLSEEQCTALWLRYVEDLPADEIGEALGRPAVTVRVVLFRARERLARHLDPSLALDSPIPQGAAPGAVLARRAPGGSLG